MPNLPDPLLRRRQRVRRVSAFLKILSVLGMVSLVAAMIATWIVPVVVIGPTYGSPQKPASPPADTPSDPLQNRLYLELAGQSPELRVFTVSVVTQSVSRLKPDREYLARTAATLFLAYGLLGCWMFFRLFKTYEHGHILTAESAQGLKHVGLWMVGLWGCGMLFQLSKVWWELHPSFHIDLGTGLIPGLFICLIAWIMEEAHLVAEEQALTV